MRESLLWFIASSLSFLQFFACLLIIFGAEITAGVFGFLNREQVLIFIHLFICLFVCLFYCKKKSSDQTNSQIAEEVQKFYSHSISDTSNSNGTAIAQVYHKTVSAVCSFLHHPRHHHNDLFIALTVYVCS